MNKLIINNQEVKLEVADDQIWTTSLQIASVFEKAHKHILAKIDELPQDDFRKPNFWLTERTAKFGSVARKERYYLVSKDGFTLLTMSFIGEKFYRFKVAYINAFNKMEHELKRSIQARIRKVDDENIALTTTIIDLSLDLDSKDKHHNRQILGYKSQIAQHNAVIADLRKKLATLEKNNLELEPPAHNVVLELIYQFTMSKLELEEARKDLDKRMRYIDRFLSGLKNRYDKGWRYARTLEQGGYN